ncbi:MAG: hypothetical protein AB1345_01235 [Chloroflexota bacterium]
MVEKEKVRRPFEGFIPDEAMEHARNAHREMRKSVEALFPPEFATHRRAARKEMLLAVRSFIDAALKRMETGEQG